MPASQPANFNLQEFSDIGQLLVGGRIYTYGYGTTAHKTAFTDPEGTVPHSYTPDGLGGQYIALNARGELPSPLYLVDGSYDIALKRADGSTVWTRKADGVDNAAKTGINTLSNSLASAVGSALMGWSTGGTTTTVKEALDVLYFGVANVRSKRFNGGAKGDGAADDTAAIKAAFAAMQGGGRVYFPAGRYRVTSSMPMAPKVDVEGAGRAQSEIYFTDSGDFTLAGAADANVGKLSIIGLGFTDQVGTGRYLLNMRYVEDVVVSECVVYNGNVGVSGFDKVTFNECRLYGGQLYADHPVVNGINNALKVVGCEGSNYRITVRDSADTMIDNTRLLGGSSQIWIQRGDQNPAFYPPTWISRTVIDSGSDEGIILSGVAPHVSGCFVSSGRPNGKNGIVLDDCTEGSLTYTMSRFNGKSGLFMRSCNNIAISNCTFNDNQLFGVSIGDSNNLRFIGNAMTNAPQWYGGSYVQQQGVVDEPGNCTNITVVLNQLGGNAVGPLYLPGATHTIHSNLGFNENIIPGAFIRSGTDNTTSVGTADFRYSTVYAATGTIATSDERVKVQREGGIDPAALRAWAKVEYAQFKFTDAIEKKGDGARWHFGLVAQRVKEAFESEGLDPFEFGLLCYDDWGDGNRYGIRYEEALALECAYLRSRLPAA